MTERDTTVLFVGKDCKIHVKRYDADPEDWNPTTLLKMLENSWEPQELQVRRRSTLNQDQLQGALGEYAFKLDGTLYKSKELLGVNRDINQILGFEFSGPSRAFSFQEGVFDFIIQNISIQESTRMYSFEEAAEWVQKTVEEELEEHCFKFCRYDPDEGEDNPYLETEHPKIYPDILWRTEETDYKKYGGSSGWRDGFWRNVDRCKVEGVAEIARRATVTEFKARQWSLISKMVDDFRLFIPADVISQAAEAVREISCTLYVFEYEEANKSFVIKEEWNRKRA